MAAELAGPRRAVGMADPHHHRPVGGVAGSPGIAEARDQGVGQLAKLGSDSWSIFRAMTDTDNRFWGNRSVIPPSSDPRTRFIDRPDARANTHST